MDKVMDKRLIAGFEADLDGMDYNDLETALDDAFSEIAELEDWQDALCARMRQIKRQGDDADRYDPDDSVHRIIP